MAGPNQLTSFNELIIGSDHAAFYLKEKLKEHLFQIGKIGMYIEDAGTYSETPVDYTDFGIKVASAVSKGKFERGILLCGTGLGMSMVANRFPHVRAALCNDLFSAIMSRRHNNSNILVMGGRVTGESLAIAMLEAWLETPFEGGRHKDRLLKMENILK